MSDEVSAASLVGLLAEDDRLRAVAALVLGARTIDGYCDRKMQAPIPLT